MHKPRVLLVEDEAGIAQVIEYTLGSEGFDCHCAATGREIGRASCRERV